MTTPADNRIRPTHEEDNEKTVRSGAELDPDAPGASALGLQDGDPVEPNEPA